MRLAHRRGAPPVAGAPASERGTGLVASVAAVTMFLAFLFFSVQLLVGLYARSVATATAYDAARRAAVAPPSTAEGADARRRAEASLRSRLGAIGEGAEIDWSGSDDGSVRLHLRARTPVLLPGTGAFGLGTIDRQIVVRVERER